MPIKNVQDAIEVHGHIDKVFAAPADKRAQALQGLFVEALDFEPEAAQVSLRSAPAGVTLPQAAHHIASLDGVHVCYVALATQETDRVRKAEAVATAKLLALDLGDDLLLVFTNTSGSQLHLIHPVFDRAQPTLRRMIVERDLPRRTAVQQVAGIYDSYLQSGSIRAALETAFDVEPVTRRFFQEYKRIFEVSEQRIIGFNTDAEDQAEAKRESEARRLFLQTLFNRLMFVHFLSRKRWLTFDGDQDYLKALWQSYQSRPDETSFYRDRLRPLFFCGLNNESSTDVNRPDGYMESVYGDVPFLNGGLFEETALDHRDNVCVPDSAIEPLIRDRVGLFNAFNFTVMESTPFDIEVAVDPEMLGKVFEELVTGRQATGSYYTPRPVVAFMCREALKGYLESRGGGLSPAAIQKFVDERDTSDIPLNAAPRVSRALNEITVVDPACGSGAYLLGMLQELVDLQTALFNVGVDARSLYHLKLHVIERNLYGVDNDDFAVNMAMLRLWLSLAIEYDGQKPDPLPNLDFKIVHADSLRGPEPIYQLQVLRSTLGDLKTEYMHTTAQTEKDRLRRSIYAERRRLERTLGATNAPAGSVNWRLDFAEVFETREGFDIIIANPPYVVISDSQLRSMYKEGVYGRMNTYGLFIQRSLQLMRSGAQLCFINPRTLLTDKYFRNLRKVIKRTSAVRGVVLIEDRHRTFAKVLQECIIIHLAKDIVPEENYEVRTRSVKLPVDLNDSTAYLSSASQNVLLDKTYDETFYIGLSDFDYHVFQRMKTTGITLAELGLKAETGKVQFDKYKEYARSFPDHTSHRLVWAENVQRYTHRESRKRVDKEWMADSLFSVIAPNITSYGIMTQRVTANEQPRRIIATLITPELLQSGSVYSENHTNFIRPEPSQAADKKYLSLVIAALNSSLIEFIFRRLNSNTQVSAGELNQLPFPRIPSDTQVLDEVERLVAKILRLGGVDCESHMAVEALQCERRIDCLVGSLYGFSSEEVNDIQRRLPSYESIYGHTISSLGRALYRSIHRQAKIAGKGDFAVVDVRSGEYEIDSSDAAATKRLMARKPDAVTYSIRIGYPSAYRMSSVSSDSLQ